MVAKIIVCVNHRANTSQPSCAARGSEELACYLEAELGKDETQIVLERFNCLGLCEQGPNIRLAPAGRFYHQVQLDDLPALLADAKQACKADAD